VKYDVNLTFEGDPAVAAQWAGFAKKKAREFGAVCDRTGQTFGTKWYDLTPDVKLKVRYANGIQKAHIIVGGAIYGFAFRVVTTSFLTGWGAPFTPLNKPMGTPGGTDPDIIITQKIQAVRTPYVSKVGAEGVLEYGSWVCQEMLGGKLITIASSQVINRNRGRGFRPAITRTWFYEDGVKWSAAGRQCYGAFRFNGTLFLILLSSLGSVGTTGPWEFNSLSRLQVWRVLNRDTLDTEADAKVMVSEFDVAGYFITENNPVYFSMSPDGSAGIATLSDDTVAYRILYLRMSYTELDDEYSATFTLGEPLTDSSIQYPIDTNVIEETEVRSTWPNGTPILDALGHATTSTVIVHTEETNDITGFTGHYLLGYDVIQLSGEWVPAKMILEPMAASGHSIAICDYPWGKVSDIEGEPAYSGKGIFLGDGSQVVNTNLQVDLVVYADPLFTGDFTTEACRAEAVIAVDADVEIVTHSVQEFDVPAEYTNSTLTITGEKSFRADLINMQRGLAYVRSISRFPIQTVASNDGYDYADQVVKLDYETGIGQVYSADEFSINEGPIGHTSNPLVALHELNAEAVAVRDDVLHSRKDQVFLYSQVYFGDASPSVYKPSFTNGLLTGYTQHRTREVIELDTVTSEDELFSMIGVV
jgi:hypothetical protein